MVSIVIPNYNGEQYLKACLEKLYEYTTLEIEVIIVDNGSTDSKYEWIKNFPSIIWKQLDNNYGFSKAVNEGIRIAKGKFVVLLNNDTQICVGFIEELKKVIEQQDTIFSVSSKMIQYHNPNYIDDVGDEYNLFGYASQRGHGKSVDCYNESSRIFSSCGGAAIYRKELLEQIGFFDENFFAYLEDVDLGYRANINGYKNVYCPKAMVYHVGSATTGEGMSPLKVYLSARNNIYLIYKNMPIIQLLINLPFLIIGSSLRYYMFKKKGFGEDYKRGLFEGIKKCNSIKKTKIQIKNLKYYFTCELMLIYNTYKYIARRISGD